MHTERDAPRTNASTPRPRIDLRWPTLRRQFAECAMLPSIAMALPWPLAWRAMRSLAARGRVFGRETSEAQAMYNAQGLPPDARSWAQRYRLIRMVDHVDPAISATRGDRWMDRYVSVDGDAIPPAPCIFIGFHFGTGFWSLRHLRRAGHRVSFVSAPIDDRQGRAEPLRLACMRVRQRCVARAGGAPIIYVGGGGDRIRAALANGSSILALIDVPEPTTSTVDVSVLGRPLRLPDGIVRIGASANVPMVGYVAALDADTGVRRLHFTRLPSAPTDALHAIAALLDRAIRADSAAWHFWGQWPRFAARPAPSPASASEASSHLR